jgi:alpha-tubulin suppressor-like RCC1 family protein
MEGGTLRCWGDGEDGQLGYGNTDNVGDDEVPADVGDVPLGETVVQVSAGGTHTCALLEQGTVRCWGRAEHGQLGQGNTTQTGHTPETLPEVVDDVPIW